MKFLESPMQTMAVGFGLAAILIMGYLGMVGVPVGDADWLVCYYAGPISLPESSGSDCCTFST